MPLDEQTDGEKERKEMEEGMVSQEKQITDHRSKITIRANIINETALIIHHTKRMVMLFQSLWTTNRHILVLRYERPMLVGC
jgi:predicted  nucleic acid-binding Zn-ribbon protein